MPLYGIDISRYQAGINLRTVPCDIVTVGTSDGASVNPYADSEYQAAVAAGKLVGVYHFFRNDPITEARFWASITKGYQNGKTVFFCDAETANPNLPALTKQFCDEFKRLTGIKPVIYTYWQFLQQYNWSACRNADYALWGAWYPLGDQPITGYLPPARQDPPYWGSSMVMWQFTSKGRLPGWNGDLDLNVFYGDRNTWLRLAAKAGTVTPEGGGVTPIQEDELAFTISELLDTPIPRKGGQSGSTTLRNMLAYADANFQTVIPAAAAAAVWETPVHRTGGDVSALQELADAKSQAITANAQVAALKSVIDQLAKGQVIDYAKINDEVTKALASGIKVTGTISGAAG
jgi:GH25 family lysozyme M1 (1,4-beta-N-acetylmuramidase)